jgi:hypothetical protein
VEVRAGLAPVRIRRLVSALVAVPVLGAAAASPAFAVPVELPGDPLKVFVDDRGQLQALRTGSQSRIFFEPGTDTGDAGFFLAFPNASPGALSGQVYGFSGSAGPTGLTEYTPVSQFPTTGSGTAGDPLTQVTVYTVESGPTEYLRVTQTTTYVNGTQEFGVRWDVQNMTASAIGFKALAAADYFFDGDDRGTGIFTQGPPRFVGGTNADTGNSGGFAELLGPPANSPAWSAYEALAWGDGSDQVWGKVENSATTTPTFNNNVVGEQVDNAGGVEWDQFISSPLPGSTTTSFAMTVRNAVPSQLQLSPTNAGSPRGVPIVITATAKDTAGNPYAGRTLRHQITGANPGNGTTVLDGSGSAQIVDPGTNAGNDTIVAFVDFNNNGTREAVEPQASALATFLDNVAPNCRVTVSGSRPGGGGAGRPLVIRVNCNERARVTVATTLEAFASRRRSSSAQRRRRRRVTIRLRPRTTVVPPGRAVPVRIRLPRSVRRKYAGRRLRARITVSARDSAGNVRRRTVRRQIRLAKIKRKRRR